MVNVLLIEQIQLWIKTKIVEKSHNQTICIFDEFVNFCSNYYDKPATTMREIRLKRNSKAVGDVFEHFCYLYLAYKIGYSEVYLLSDVPTDVKQKLDLPKQDFGIDLVVLNKKSGMYSAVQAKFRKHNAYKQKTALGWKQLSTFYALVSKTGPWERYIVMTNADYCIRKGTKTKNDWSICLGTLRKTKLSDWLKMSGSTANLLVPKRKLSVISNEELRQKRLKYFDQQYT